MGICILFWHERYMTRKEDPFYKQKQQEMLWL